MTPTITNLRDLLILTAKNAKPMKGGKKLHRSEDKERVKNFIVNNNMLSKMSVGKLTKLLYDMDLAFYYSKTSVENNIRLWCGDYYKQNRKSLANVNKNIKTNSAPIDQWLKSNHPEVLKAYLKEKLINEKLATIEQELQEALNNI